MADSTTSSTRETQHVRVMLLSIVCMAALGFVRVEDRGLLDPPGITSGKAFAAASTDVIEVETDEVVPVRRAGRAAKKLRRRLIDRLANVPFAPPREVFGQPANAGQQSGVAPEIGAFAANEDAVGDDQLVRLASLGAPSLARVPGARVFAANVGGPGGSTGGGTGGSTGGGTDGGSTGGGSSGGGSSGGGPGGGVVNPIPEPQSWILLILGFGLLGRALRGERHRKSEAVL